MEKVIGNPFMLLIVLISMLLTPEVSSASGWSVNPADYRYDMSLYFELSIAAAESDSLKSDYDVAAFVDNECRGVAQSLPGVDNCLYMRIRSNSPSGEDISFKIRNKMTGEISEVENVSISFDSGKAIGLPSDPYKLIVEKYFNVTITASEGGSVSSQGGRFKEGHVLDVTATPDEKFVFEGWSDGVAEPQRTITVDNDIEISASFKRNVFSITYMADGQTVAVKEVVAGQEILPVEAPEKEGYEFAGWQGLPQIMPEEDITVVAAYDRYFIVTITASEGGSVSSKGGRFKEGHVLDVTATPDEKFVFEGWSDGVAEPQRTITVDNDIEICASFKRNVFSITYMVDGQTVAVKEVVAGQEILPVEAPEKEGYEFAGWQGLPQIMPEEDITVIATYEAMLYNLTVYLDDEVYFHAELVMGAPIEIPTPELPSDKLFNGWDDEIPETMPAHDLDIYGTTTFLSGLTSIFPDNNTTLTVYDLQGRLILKDINIQEATQRLSHGMYIINGKKIIIRPGKTTEI